ncbi:MAG: hypothetical protein REI94_12235 [Moraxellaceae bacterium]|nr:hypothetical protein [Moraxellaceae bacterium]
MKTQIKLMSAIVSGVLLSTSMAVSAADATDSAQYKAEKTAIEKRFKADKESCDTLSGNAKDICEKQAKFTEVSALGELEANAKGTVEARRDAEEDKAKAAYDLAREKCDDLSGNRKDVCQKDAVADRDRMRADIKAGGTVPPQGTLR